MNGLTDEQLMALYRDGDAEAFDVLFDRYYLSVYNLAGFMLHDAAAAEDVLQETFLAVARSAGQYESRGAFRGWLLRIVRNRCLNRMASRRAQREAIAGSGLELIDPPSPAPDPHQKVQDDETAAVVRDAMRMLPDRQREAMVLHAFEQMKYQEIAEILNMPLGTVKTLIHRARASLARALDGRLGGDKP